MQFPERISTETPLEHFERCFNSSEVVEAYSDITDRFNACIGFLSTNLSDMAKRNLRLGAAAIAVQAKYEYTDVQSGRVFIYSRQGNYTYKGRPLVLVGASSGTAGDIGCSGVYQ